MLANLFNLSLLLAAPLAAWANPHNHAHLNRHVEIAKRHAGDVQLHKRFSSARWTFYDVGVGACGKTNIASDFIVALNSAQYGGGYPGPSCFKTITMTYNGKTTQATIMDECPGCPYGGLDLSRGLFTFFAPESTGVLYGTWSFNDGGAPPPPPTTTKEWLPPLPTFTWTPPKPTTTFKPQPTTTWTPEPTTSSTSSTKYSSSSAPPTSSSKPSSSAVTSSSVAPAAPSIVPQPPQNLPLLSQSLLQLGGLIVAAV